MEWKQSGHEVRATFQAFSSSSQQTRPRTHASQMAFIFHTMEPREPSFIVTRLFLSFSFLFLQMLHCISGPFQRNIVELIRKRTTHKTDRWQIVDAACSFICDVLRKALHSFASMEKNWTTKKKRNLGGSAVHLAPPHNQAALSKEQRPQHL